MKLNIGSGEKVAEGYVNYDIRDLPGVDVVDDVWNLVKHAPQEGYEEIQAVDFIEHFSHRETDRLLKLLYQVLAPEGNLYLQLPDLRYLAVCLVHGWYPDETVAFNIYGGQEFENNFHKAGFTPRLICEALGRIGFKEVVWGRQGVFNMVVRAKR